MKIHALRIKNDPAPIPEVRAVQSLENEIEATLGIGIVQLTIPIGLSICETLLPTYTAMLLPTNLSIA